MQSANCFFLLNRQIYTDIHECTDIVQNNVDNNKTEIEIIQSQTKSKTSLPCYVHVVRDKTQKRKA